MNRSNLPLRATLLAAFLVGTAGAADAANVITVNFKGVLSTNPATTITGLFRYDADKPVDRKSGAIVFGQFTFTGNAAYQHLLQSTASKPFGNLDVFCITTNPDTVAHKTFELTVQNNTEKYVITLKTPAALDQSTLPNSCEFPTCTAPGTGPGTGTFVKTVGTTTTKYNIYVTSCSPPCASLPSPQVPSK